MSFIEDFRKRFKGKQSLEGIDEDALWAGISDTLDDIEQPKGKKKRKFIFLLFFFGVLATGLITIYTLNDFNDNKTTSEFNSTEIVIDNKIGLKENNSSTSLEKEIEDIVIVKENITTNNKERKGGNDLISNNDNKFDINFTKNEIEIIADNDSYLNKNNNSFDNKNISSFNDNSGVLIQDNSGQITSPNFQETSTNNFNERDDSKRITLDNKSKTLNDDVSRDILNDGSELNGSIPSVVLIEEKELPLWLSPILLSTIYSINNKTEHKEISRINMKKSEWEIGAFIGGNIVFNSFGENNSNPDLNDKLDESNKIELGYSTAFNAYWNCEDKFHIKTGLEFIEQQLQYNTVHTYATVASRTGFSGQTELIPAVATRTIAHDNKFRYLSIPVEIGIRQRFNNFDIGISAGLGLNYFVSQKGKSLNYNNDIQEMANGKENAPYRRAFISYQINPFVSYHVTNKMAIRLNQNLRYQNHGTSSFYGLKQTSILTGLNIGAVYKL